MTGRRGVRRGQLQPWARGRRQAGAEAPAGIGLRSARASLRARELGRGRPPESVHWRKDPPSPAFLRSPLTQQRQEQSSPPPCPGASPWSGVSRARRLRPYAPHQASPPLWGISVCPPHPPATRAPDLRASPFGGVWPFPHPCLGKARRRDAAGASPPPSPAAATMEGRAVEARAPAPGRQQVREGAAARSRRRSAPQLPLPAGGPRPVWRPRSPRFGPPPRVPSCFQNPPGKAPRARAPAREIAYRRLRGWAGAPQAAGRGRGPRGSGAGSNPRPPPPARLPVCLGDVPALPAAAAAAPSLLLAPRRAMGPAAAVCAPRPPVRRDAHEAAECSCWVPRGRHGGTSEHT